MQISLDQHVAWITGAGEGIGRSVALLAARCGAKVALTGLTEDKLEQVARQIEQRGGEAMAVRADISDSDQVKQAVQQIVERWGHIDLICANAGINGTWAPIEELHPDEWSKTISVNLTGTYLTIHHALPHMNRQGRGSIVIVSSVNGTRIFSNKGASAYATSKAGQMAFGKMLALELAPERIRVNVICPGAIDTGIHDKTERRDLDEIDIAVEFPEGKIPLTEGEMGKPLQIAQLVVFLASDAASHITGTPVWIDGGESLLMG